MGKRPKSLSRARPHPKWGATKAQGDRNAEIRGLKNRIHELEVENRRITVDLAGAVDRRLTSTLMSMVVPNGHERDLIGGLLHRIPIHRAIEYDVLEQMLALGKWFERVRKYNLALLASGQEST